MSFPGKENLIYFENLVKTQTQLFDDACDMGVEVTPGSDTWSSTAKKNARKNLMELMELYPYKLNKYATGSVTDIFIPFEFDEGAYNGVTLNVDFCKAGPHEYLLIDIRRDRKTHAEANANGPLYKPKALGPEEDEFDCTEYACSDDDESAYLAEQGRSNPNVWAEAAYEAKRFN